MAFSVKGTLLLSSSASLLLGLGGTALAQTPAPGRSGTTVLPGIQVVGLRPPRHRGGRAASRAPPTPSTGSRHHRPAPRDPCHGAANRGPGGRRQEREIPRGPAQHSGAP